ncbi:GIY-YIG nuclease family protein [Candidatus Woesebacteria bacterium]|nr:GIY-YIG nuclease family protein [Candidatus Woesebacteria bacterium]
MVQSKNGYVYVLKCCNGSYNTGATKNWKVRLQKHNNGGVKFTKSKLPVELVFLKEFSSYSKALQFERKVKSWKKRSSIEKMFNKKDNLFNNLKYGPIV